LNSERSAEVTRKTSETQVELKLNLEGNGHSLLQTGLPFWEHMLEQFSKHGNFDLSITAQGDTQVDQHHLVEDLGICLGAALNRALGTKGGIKRYGSSLLPMDDALVMVVIDLSGRPYLHYQMSFPVGKVGDVDTELAEEFCRALVNEGRFNLHVKLMHGSNAHHIMEALFKGLGKALGDAVDYRGEDREIPSTKGSL